ncbi:MAG: alpha-L-arabinofuranosidase C-terminal domain-containing protein, partial [Chloroflexota bacterium]
MAANLPDFIVNKIFLKDTLEKNGDGFTFTLNNTFAPVVIYNISIESDGGLIARENIIIIPVGQNGINCDEISVEQPLPFSINVPYKVQIKHSTLPKTNITLFVETRDAGQAVLFVNLRPKKNWFFPGFKFVMPILFSPSLAATVQIFPEEIVGEINPFVYGQFIEHLERCIYGGVFSSDGSEIRQDVFDLIKPLQIPILRYPGGNFASGYHWEDGIGSPSERVERFDRAWSAAESNKVGTDEYMGLVENLGSAPFIVVNDGSGTPAEAARWVEYCNAISGVQADRRTKNGHPEPYHVKIWGIGNEVWGRWQIGTTTAKNYAERLILFSEAMRKADPSIQIVAVGNTIHTDADDDPGKMWNEEILQIAGGHIDYLSFHLYQPDQDGWKDDQNPIDLYYSVCAAAYEGERMINRLGKLLEKESPSRKIGIAVDEWNLWLTPPKNAGSMHQVNYPMRDALYCAAMLNVFHRQSRYLSIANFAQLVNVLPMIMTNDDQTVTTAMYWPFWMYSLMQKTAIRSSIN